MGVSFIVFIKNTLLIIKYEDCNNKIKYLCEYKNRKFIPSHIIKIRYFILRNKSKFVSWT